MRQACEIQTGCFRLSSNSLHQLKNWNGHKRVIKGAASRFMTCIHSTHFICICRKAIILVKANLSANFWENRWLSVAQELFKVVFFFYFCPRVVQAKMWFQVWSCQAGNILFVTSTFVFFWPSGCFILLQTKRCRLASTCAVSIPSFGQPHR